MNTNSRRVAIVVIVALLSALAIAAWNGYRQAAWLLLLHALPFCG